MKLTRAEREDLRRRLADLEKVLGPEREALAPMEGARKGLLTERLARVVGGPAPGRGALSAQNGRKT